MTKEKDLDTFFLAFCGQEMTITTIIIVPGEDPYPMFFEGILLDYDENNYYLGALGNPNEITEFIPRNQVIHGKIKNDSETAKEFLNQIPRPENEEEIN